MRVVIQLIVILGVLIAFGAAKLRFEHNLHQDMVQERLLQPPLKQDTSIQLEQTSYIVALGGLRSLVAAILNLRAFSHFEDLNWIKLEESYELITTLQPQTTPYWETGAWHLHTNASVHYIEDKKLSPMRRKALQKKYISKGSAFLEDGLKQNPDNWRLHRSLAWLWSDRHKLPDFPKAVKHYDDMLASETFPEYARNRYTRARFYALARVPERQEEALHEGVRIFRKTPDNHLPNMVCVLFALQNAQSVAESERIPDHELFPDGKTQYLWLNNYRARRSKDFIMDGVDDKLRELQKKLRDSAPRR